MADVTATYNTPMSVPANGNGMVITDDAGNTLSIASVTQGSNSNKLVYTGPWSPSDPIAGINTVSLVYTESSGNHASVEGLPLGNFSGVAVACGNASALLATVINDDNIDLSWTESPDDPSVTYELFRDNVSIQTFVHGNSSYSDTGLDPETLYNYRLDTLVGGNSIGSVTTSGTTDVAAFNFVMDAGFVDFQSGDPAILASYAMTSPADIGPAVVTGTPTYDLANGLSIAPLSGDRLTFDNDLVPVMSDLDTGCTIQFEVESSVFYSLGASVFNYLFTWGNASKFYYVQGNNDPNVKIQNVCRTVGGGTQHKTPQLNVEGKGLHTEIQLSFDIVNNVVDVFIDRSHVAAIPDDEIATTDLFTSVGLFNVAGQNFGFPGGIKNLQVLNRPLNTTSALGNAKIHFIGDSICEKGNFEANVGTNFPFDSRDTALVGIHDDVGILPTLQRKMFQSGRSAVIRCFGRGSTYADDTHGALDILDQVNGVGNGTALVNGDAMLGIPEILVMMGGYNDAITPATSKALGGPTDLGYRKIITEARLRNPLVKIFCSNLGTVNNDPAFSAQNYIDSLDQTNALIDQVVADTSDCFLIPWFTVSGGHAANTDLFLVGDFHESSKGSRLHAEAIFNVIDANVNS